MLRILLAAAFLFPLAARADIDPGNWEMSVTSTFEGMQGAIGPIVQTRCFTGADVRDPSRVLGFAATSSCEFTNRRDTGTEFTFDVRCSGQVPMQGSGQVTYGPESMQVDISLAAETNGQKFTTRSRISGRKLGPC